MRYTIFIGLLGVSAAGNAFAQTASFQNPSTATPSTQNQPAGAIGASAAGQPAWQFIPSIAIEEGYTDNSDISQSGQRSDAITRITPGFTIIGETARTNLVLTYEPTISLYALGTSDNRVDHYLNGSGNIVPLTNYLDISFAAYANEVGGNGNYGYNQSSSLISDEDRVFYYLFSAAPHFHDRFGDIATLDAYYRVSTANSSQEGTRTSVDQSYSNNLLQQDAQVIIGSSESFGRLVAQLNFDHAFTSGSQQSDNSTTDTDYLSLEYHFNHKYSLVGTIGYQRIHYDPSGDTAGYNNEGATFSGGFRFTPNDLSSLYVAYGRSQGSNNPTVQASYALGPRTKLAINYVVTVQNQLQSTLQDLNFLSHDALGNAVDTRNGLPFGGINQTFSSRNVLFRDRPLQVAVTHEFIRSSISFTALYETRDALGGLPATDDAWGGDITYSRQLMPTLQGNIDFGYTDHRTTGAINSGNEHAKIINVGISLSYAVNDSSNIYFNESYFDRSSDIASSNDSVNQVTIGFRKEF